MAFTLEYTSTVHETTYTLTATSDGTIVTLDLHGGAGAEGSMRLPPGAAAAASGLLRQALDAIAVFEGKPPRRRTGNAYAPWTAIDDAALRAQWLAYPATTPATEAIGELAAGHARSRPAIRARLGHIGCDPDVSGRLLTAEAAEVVGRNAIPGAA